MNKSDKYRIMTYIIRSQSTSSSTSHKSSARRYPSNKNVWRTTREVLSPARAPNKQTKRRVQINPKPFRNFPEFVSSPVVYRVIFPVQKSENPIDPIRLVFLPIHREICSLTQRRQQFLPRIDRILRQFTLLLPNCPQKFP